MWSLPALLIWAGWEVGSEVDTSHWDLAGLAVMSHMFLGTGVPDEGVTEGNEKPGGRNELWRIKFPNQEVGRTLGR